MSIEKVRADNITIEIPTDADKRREWIKYRLKIKGTSLAALGREHETSRQNVSTALYRSNPRWEFIIAETLGLAPSEIWPERYDAKTGIPKKVENN